MKNQFPVSRVKMYAVLFIANLFLTVFRLVIFPDFSTDFHVLTTIASLFGFWGLWEYILLLSDYLEKKLPLTSTPNKRIIIQILATYAVATIFGVLMIEASVMVFNIKIPAIIESFGYLMYFMLSIVMNLIYFGTQYFFNWKKDLVRLTNVQREQTLMKYNALKNQLNPHFLFNALTSLNSLIFEDQKLASEFLQQLSKVYRYLIHNKERETVSLGTELEFITHYISLLITRFGTAIEIKLEQEKGIEEKQIVPVTLQILIENAIKHNVMSRERPLKISIRTYDGHIEVVNSVNKKTQVENSNRQGLENLRSLYQYLIDKPIHIVDTGVQFTVRIPLI
jgi:hypothetical protein